MRDISLLFGLCLSMAGFGSDQLKQAGRPIVLEHVNVVDTATGVIKRDCRIVLRGDRIESVGPVWDPAQVTGAEVFNLTGKYLIPGLWDMHVHFPPRDGASDTTNDDYLALYVLNGVTGVREMWADVPDDVFQYRRDTANGTRFGPHIVAAGYVVDGERPCWHRATQARNAKEGQEVVRELKKQGADFIKIYSKLSPEAYYAIARECRAQGMMFAGHVPESVSARDASRAGQRSMEHLYGVLLACSDQEDALRKEVMRFIPSGDNAAVKTAMARAQEKAIDSYNPAKAKALFATFAENHTWQDPTLVTIRAAGRLDDLALAKDSRLKYFSRGEVMAWKQADAWGTADRRSSLRRIYQRNLKLIGDMRDAGVKFLAGTDVTYAYCMPGFSLHDELAQLVEAHLTPLEALQAATCHAALCLGLLDRYGTVSPGKCADLVVLDANPLEDIHNSTKIHAVILNGKVLDRSAIDKRLAVIEERARRR
jgi:imidazolonepropionase-like amidohydrolase